MSLTTEATSPQETYPVDSIEYRLTLLMELQETFGDNDYLSDIYGQLLDGIEQILDSSISQESAHADVADLLRENFFGERLIIKVADKAVSLAA